MFDLEMENEYKLIALDGEIISVEVALKSTAIDETLKSTAIEELKCTAMEEELKCIAMEEELKCTTMEEKIKPICPICDKTFSKTSKRNYHMRQIHNLEPTNSKRNVICPLSDCREKFFQSATLREHIVQTHKIDLEAEEITFQSYEDFSVWKENMERETNSHYVKKNVNKYMRRGKGVLRDYYACDRSGVFTPNGTGKRKFRRIGSKRIGAFCPAALVVTRSRVNTYVKVIHWKKHLGHKCDMYHLPLKESEKREIVDKIHNGMTFSEIIKYYRNSVDGPQLHRINCLSHRDLSNIVEQFKRKRDQVPEGDDYLVNRWVKNMEEFGKNSPVAFFKKQGMEHEQLDSKDFMIVIMTKYQKEMAIKYSGKNICIDSIHGLTSHSFFLTSLLTIDELSAVFPLAYCISSKIDEVSMTVFFESVKKLVGSIETPVFMSNDDPAFYNAWEKIMAPASFQLLCSWHVDSCWRRDLDKISDREKRSSVYKTLRMLLEESDVSEFESCIYNFATELEEDASTRKFSEYFCENYLPRVKMWAFCYMRHLGISTVEHLETMHTFLKNLFLDGGTDDNVYNSQVNLAIPALLKLGHDKLLDRLDELLECLPRDWIDKIRKSHKKALKACEITALSNNSWSVKLFRREDGYVVTVGEASCSQDVCYLRCLMCNICIHSFFCTCFDNLIMFNICGHIHACARFCRVSKSIKVPVNKEKNNDVITNGKEESVDTIVVQVPVNKEKMNDVITNEKEESVDTTVVNEEVIETFVKHQVPSSSKILLTKQLNTIKTMMEYAEYTEEHASQLKNSFDAIISFMVMHGKSRKPLIRVPYQPPKEYFSTLKMKSEIQYQNQIIPVGQPICVYTVNNIKKT